MITTNSTLPAAWRRPFFLLCLLGFYLGSWTGSMAQPAATANRWKINPDGSTSWVIDKRIPHVDHIEMSGEKISTIVRYGVNAEGAFTISRSFVWPLLRFQPNKTHNHLA